MELFNEWIPVLRAWPLETVVSVEGSCLPSFLSQHSQVVLQLEPHLLGHWPPWASTSWSPQRQGRQEKGNYHTGPLKRQCKSQDSTLYEESCFLLEEGYFLSPFLGLHRCGAYWTCNFIQGFTGFNNNNMYLS